MAFMSIPMGSVPYRGGIVCVSLGPLESRLEYYTLGATHAEKVKG